MTGGRGWTGMRKRGMHRMRVRMTALLLLAVMVLPWAGAGADGVIPNLTWAQPTATPAPAFSFRGGVTWNMTREQVRAAEPTLEMTERSQGNWSILYPLTQVDVSRFKADLVYMFYGDQLKMITYDFGSGGTAADYAYLTGALESVYGEHAEPDASVVVTIMDQIYPGYYTASNLHSVRSWTAGEDTWIYLYYYTQTAYGILYVNAVSGSPSGGGYVTTGL